MFENIKDAIKSYKGMAITLGNKEWELLKDELWNDNYICKESKDKIEKQNPFIAFGNVIYYQNIESKFYTHRLMITNITPNDDASVYVHKPFQYSKRNYGM